jgi:radical SAM superfamily enzyme YgiQ (UPF0313 family)
VHVSLGTEAAAQLKLDRFNKEIKVEQSKKAIQLLRKNGIVAEAQFIVGSRTRRRRRWRRPTRWRRTGSPTS